MSCQNTASRQAVAVDIDVNFSAASQRPLHTLALAGLGQVASPPEHARLPLQPDDAPKWLEAPMNIEQFRRMLADTTCDRRWCGIQNGALAETGAVRGVRIH